jgi:hypothetical protein
VPTAGSKTVVANGTTYTRTVCYRWIDDPGDDTGIADRDLNTKDVKRIEVVLSWPVKGQTRTHFRVRAAGTDCRRGGTEGARLVHPVRDHLGDPAAQ